MILRILIFTFFVSASLLANCQDTIYFDKNQNYANRNSAFYLQVTHEDFSNPERYIVESFYTNGTRKELKNYTDKKKERIGISEEWYLNGQLKSQETYANGKLNDTVITYWENGQLKRMDLFRNGEFINGTCYDISGKKIRHFDFEVMPKYPGGESELLADIYNDLEMPEIVKKNLLKEKVIAKFSVDIKGFVSDIEIVKGNYPELNNEVIRVLKSLKRWQPGLRDGEPVKVWYSIPVSFEVR